MDEAGVSPPIGQPKAVRVPWVRLSIGLVVALALLALLFGTTSLRDASVWSALARYPLAIGAIAMLSAAIQTALNTLKWRMLLDRVSPEIVEVSGTARLYAYTSTSAAVAQILPPYIAGPMVRGLAMKAKHAAGFAKSAAVAGVEQGFDALTLVVAGTVALALLLIGGSGSWAIGTVALALIVLCLVLNALPQGVNLATIARVLPQRRSVIAKLRGVLEAASASGLDEPRFIGRQSALSTIRYFVIGARTVLLGLLLIPAVDWQTIGLGFAAVLMVTIASVTPGNLGITESGWSAMSVFTDQAVAGEFVAFALALRLISLLAAAALAALSWVFVRRD